jgi:phosphoribosylaminoimidazole-succinocarboxamide synthase
MNLKKKKKLYEGKTKKLYEVESEKELVIEFKDDVVQSNGVKKGVIKGKGIILNKISSFLFRLIESYNIPTHFIKQLSDRDMLVKKMQMIPIRIVIRNIAAGSLVERYGVEEGRELECPIFEFYLKDDERHNPMITEGHIVSFGHATANELREIHRWASKVNVILKDFFRRRGYKLVDFRLEFGRYGDRIYIGDEIGPDTCSFWDLESTDKSHRLTDPARMEAAYQKLLGRVLADN